MKFGVVIFPGSNCDHDMVYTLREKLGQEVVELWHKSTDLQACDFIVLPGGFSYGDYLRSGAIARLSPIMNSVVHFANKGGYVLGICNGFQILSESGLLGEVALLHNNNQQFICKNTCISSQTKSSFLTSQTHLHKALTIPIAHGEGRFFAQEDELKRIQDEDRVLFRYCGPAGETSDEYNPNGSVDRIAGITNKGRNVVGMMPHPERAADEELGNTDGLVLFESILSRIS